MVRVEGWQGSLVVRVEGRQDSLVVRVEALDSTSDDKV